MNIIEIAALLFNSSNWHPILAQTATFINTVDGIKIGKCGMQRLFSHSGAAIEEVVMYRSLNNIYVKNDGGGERSHSFRFFIRLLCTN